MSILARSFPALPEHLSVELSTTEVLALTLDAKVRDLEAQLATSERAAADAQLLAEREILAAARLREEISGWRSLRRWLQEDGPVTEPAESGWTSAVGPLPASVLPRSTDPIIAAWLDLIHARQDVLAERLSTIVGALAALPEDLAGSLLPLLRGEVGEGLAKALLHGRQGACSLCRGEGCASPSCRG